MLTATSEIESQLWDKGYNLVCGIDEVGRGCFAGPVVAGAVVFSKDSICEGIASNSRISWYVNRLGFLVGLGADVG